MVRFRWLAPVALICLSACGGGGSTAGGGSISTAPSPAPAPTSAVTVSGALTYDRVPFSATSSAGLDFGAIVSQPIRGATVEALSASSQSVLASTTADASGQYSLSVPASTDLFIRVKAELRRSGGPAWTVSVRDNTSADALYVLDSASFNSCTAAVTRNLNAATGWSAGGGYTGARAAAPFAVLDVAWQAIQLVLTAEPAATLPELRLFWSTRNLDCAEGTLNGQPYCNGTSAARARGEIGTSFFANIAGQGRSIYVLGAAGSDTDEFDAHVIAHEWGHYYQDAFSRDDSVGGPHSVTDRLDLRVAFSEGWGNAFAAMVRNDPVYRDSFIVGGLQRDFRIDVETNPAPPAYLPGWFSEASVQSILYDVYDVNADGADNVALGFGPIHAAMTGPVRTSTAFSSVYPLIRALRDTAGVATLVAAQNINVASDDFASNETNGGNVSGVLPIYPVISPGVPRQLCSLLPGADSGATYNKLGNRKFVRFDLAVAQNVTLAVTGGSPGSDPDILLYSRGVLSGSAEGADSGTETLNLTGLPAGTYIAEIYEYSNIDPQPTPRGTECFTVRLTTS
ncbi:MAG: hypothetical protein U1F11_06980 [Steroidobacteraceae bacterium]